MFGARHVALTVLATCLTAPAQVEVLYVAAPVGNNEASIVTYNVDPNTAVATQTGSPITVATSMVNPLTVGNQHVIYVWNATDVWLYQTDSSGAPASQPAQHLTFNFPHPVNTFVADPDGKFAYAGLIWTDAQGNSHAAVVLFTIDAASRELTDTRKLVASYVNLYTYPINFSFGVNGAALFMRDFDNGPFTCDPGYDYYLVNKSTGALGPLTDLISVSSDCGGTSAVAVTDLLTGAQNTCCGRGSGELQVTYISTGQSITCGASMISFCGDDGNPVFDPASRNVFFVDSDLNQVSVGHIDFAGSKLLSTDSLIPGNPPLYFSPDSRLVFAVQPDAVDIYPFQLVTGQLGENVPITVQAGATLATTLLP